MIAMGHHTNLAKGLEILEEMANHINSFGRVQWSNMETITRSSFLHRLRGDCLEIKMFSNRVELDLPEGNKFLRISQKKRQDTPALLVGEAERGSLRKVLADEEIPVANFKKLLFEAESGVACSNGSARPCISLWAILRRQLAEGRDRASPILGLR